MAVCAHSMVLCNTLDIPKSPSLTILADVRNIFERSNNNNNNKYIEGKEGKRKLEIRFEFLSLDEEFCDHERAS